MSLFTAIALGAILAVAAFFNGGTQVAPWHYCAAAVGLVGLAYGVTRAVGRSWRAALSLPLMALLGVTVAICIVQLVPLPLGALRILSPESAELYQATAQQGSVTSVFPISVVPSATFDATLSLLAYLVVFLLTSDVAARGAGRGRQLAIPLVAISVFEAGLGILQTAAGTKRGGSTGTFQNHNHFAGLLELCLPFAAMFALAGWRRVARNQGSVWETVPSACGWLGAATIVTLAAAASLSRMGFLAALAALFASGAAVVVVERRSQARRAWLPVAAAAVGVLLLLVLLPSTQFIERYGSVQGSGEITSDTRVNDWRDTAHLAAAFPILGCGFGAFQSAAMRYQTATPMLTLNFAHNDYLQLLAELGAVGFLALMAVAVIVYRTLLRNLWEQRHGPELYVYAACLGSLVAISLHSLVDFNLYKPANAMIVAWVAGMATGRQRDKDALP